MISICVWWHPLVPCSSGILKPFHKVFRISFPFYQVSYNRHSIECTSLNSITTAKKEYSVQGASLRRFASLEQNEMQKTAQSFRIIFSTFLYSIRPPEEYKKKKHTEEREIDKTLTQRQKCFRFKVSLINFSYSYTRREEWLLRLLIHIHGEEHSTVCLGHGNSLHANFS